MTSEYPSSRIQVESGIDWIGPIPKHWPTVRLKYLASLVNEKETEQSSYSLRIGLENIEGSTGKLLTSMEGEAFDGAGNVFQQGDVLFSKLRPYLAKALRADSDGVCVSDLLVLRPAAGKMCAEFLFFWVISHGFLAEVNSATYGTKMPRASWEFISNLPIAVPPVVEQYQLTSYLTANLEKIDAMVRQKQRLLVLLEELRASTINQAVTKGLTPIVQMKDSGLKWIGAIPEHWVIKRLKYVVPAITVGIVVEPSKYYVDSGVPCLRSLNVKPHRLVEDNLVFITSESNDVLKKSQIFRGDLVAVRSGQPGATAIVDDRFDGANCIDLIIIRKPVEASEEFLEYYLNAEIAKGQFAEGADGAIQQHFNISTASNLLVLCPPLEEQCAIAAFLRSEMAQIDACQKKLEASIKLLKQYRETFISAGVRGSSEVWKQVEWRGTP